jgi:tripartite-type tricarboxylate transporter receptor subunit TctC
MMSADQNSAVIPAKRAFRAFTRVCDALWRARAGTHFAASAGRERDPGSALWAVRDDSREMSGCAANMGNGTTRRFFVGGLAACGLMPMRAVAQPRPIRIVVPFAPGGGADLIARMLQPHLQTLVGAPFYVENRAGAAGRIGTDAVAKAEPDGQTLLMTTESSLVIAPHVGLPMTYDPLKDFAPISLLTRNTVVLVVHPSVPAGTLAEYIALARAKPGQMFYASSGVGGPNHLAGEIFKQMAGVDIVHVPFPGTGSAIPAVISNQVGAMWGFLAGLITHIRAGSMKVLAVGGKDRSPILPDVPTVAETVPGYEAASWIGWLAPAATPRPLIDKLAAAAKSAIEVPAVKNLLVRDGSEIVASTPDEFRRTIESDYVKYANLKDLLKGAQ